MRVWLYLFFCQDTSSWWYRQQVQLQLQQTRWGLSSYLSKKTPKHIKLLMCQLNWNMGIGFFQISVRISLTMSFAVGVCAVLSTGKQNVDLDSLFFNRVGCHTSVRGAEILLVHSEGQGESGTALVHYFLVFVPQQRRLFSCLHQTQQGAAVGGHAQCVHCGSWDGIWRRH